MLSNISKKRFFTDFKSRCDDTSKKVTTPLCLTNFSYLFYLINCKIMMRSIYKLTLKATVAVYNILETDILILKNFFVIWVFFHEHSWFTLQLGNRKATSLTPLYYFHPFYRHLDISWVITTGGSHLHIGA